eukprot:2133917-Rhodomonas_salina.2
MADEESGGPQKFDQVAINSIWREHIKKERAILKLNDKFRLNPKALTANMITEKPNVAPERLGYTVQAEPEMVGKNATSHPKRPVLKMAVLPLQ